MQKETRLLLQQGRIWTMAGTKLDAGDILIENGKIKEIAEHITLEDSSDIRILNVSKLTVMPGLIEAHCHIGISEERKGVEGDDCNETTSPVTPWLRGLDAINPMDAAFSKAVEAGITSVMAGPGSSNVVGGQFVFMKTAGSRCIDDLVVKEPAALKAAFGENPKTLYGGKDVLPGSRMGIAGLLREELTHAKKYLADCQNNKQNKEQNKEPGDGPDFRLNPYLPVLRKEIPLKCHAHRADDIFTAIRIAKEFDINITLDHCTEGHLIAEELKKAGFPAIVGPDFTSRSKIEVENMAFKTAAILQRAGVLVAITTDHPVSLIQSLPICAGLAIKNGLPINEGLKAITINPAKICGVADRVGSLEVGKDADIAVFDGNPVELFTHCMLTIINGEIVYENK